MAELVCLDASILVKLYLAEPGSEEARELVARALMGGDAPVGPSFIRAEVVSTLRRAVHRGELLLEDGNRLVKAFLALPIQEIGGQAVYRRAWELAADINAPVVYDTVYLAVAESVGAVFWTADARLCEKAKGLGYVKLLGSVGR